MTKIGLAPQQLQTTKEFHGKEYGNSVRDLQAVWVSGFKSTRKVIS
jgi:hypothetical protein